MIEEIKKPVVMSFSGMLNIDMLAPNYTPIMTQCNYSGHPQPRLPVPLQKLLIEPFSNRHPKY